MIYSSFLSRARAVLMVAGLAAVAALPAPRPAEAVPNYDGVWSVVIMTKLGVCDTAYRYPIRISKGHVVNAGNANVTISGNVGKDGSLIVNVSAGDKTATGTGKLVGKAGSGSWTGGNGACSGDWVAERRS